MKARKISFAFLIIFTLIIFSYFCVCFGFLISDSYTIIEGSSVKSALPPGIYPEDTLQVSDNGRLENGKVVSSVGTKTITLKVLNIIPVKKVSVNTVETPLLYPSGECIGIKMYSKGIIVTGFSDFETKDGIIVSPGAVAGLKNGDIIVSINGEQTASVKEFTDITDKADGECLLNVKRGNKNIEIKVKPEFCTDGHKRMGVLVKNSIAGVGTMTYVSKEDNAFAALGHGVADSDTGITIPMQSATVYKSQVLSVSKGEKGKPGEIAGAIDEANLIGECVKNSQGGVFGVLGNYSPSNSAVFAAPRSEVTEGDAVIICTVDDTNIAKQYDVRILSVNRISLSKTKSFTIEVTDKELLDKTGGIIQGMSGSPILQNGKLIGAVTHVFVNDPTRGYGIFIENMLEEAKKAK